MAPDRPWLAAYPPGVPAVFEPTLRNAVELFQRAAELRPDGPAIHYFDTTLTYARAQELAESLAAAFRALGVEPGDRVALYLQNVPQFALCLHAAWLAGAIVTPVNPMLKERELAFQLGNAGARLLVCLESLYETVEHVRDSTPVEVVVTTSELDLLDDVPAPLAGSERIPCPGALDLLELAAAHEGRRIAPADPDPSTPALLTYTSGTTGPPKGAMNTHRNVAYNAEHYRYWMDMGPDDVVVGVAPLFHITGLVGHLAIARCCAVPLILLCRFDAGELLRLIERWRGTFVIGPLTAFIALLDHPDRPLRDLSTMTKVFSGGAPVSPAVVERFERDIGAYIHNIYGATEVTSPSHGTPLGAHAPVDPETGALSIGVPMCGVESLIVDLETGAELPNGEVGEIVTRGPMVVPGYWQKPEETAHAIRDGWFHTGDVGKRDDDGWFYLVDRAKDQINAGGYKIWPREVEDVLYEHPAVREASVVGVPDAYRGETVKAFVTLKPDAGAVTPEELIEHCRRLLAAYKYPRLVEILDEIPKTPSGKILRRELRARHEAPSGRS